MLQDEVTERLLDRLEDCRRSFRTAVVLGGAGAQVAQRLAGGRAGVQVGVPGRAVRIDDALAPPMLRPRLSARSMMRPSSIPTCMHCRSW